MYRPSLSVIIPNYNHGHYISEAIESLLEQSLPPTEIIVVDDGSTDNSIDILEDYVRRNKNIRLIRNSSNKGAGHAFNRGFSESSGDYCYNFAADDKVLPGFFEKTVALLEKYFQAGMCSVYLKFIDPQGNVIALNKLPFFHTHETYINLSTPKFLRPTEVLDILSKKPWFIGGMPSVIFRRSALRDAGGSIQELGLLADWFAVHYVALKYGMCYLHEPLAAFRIMPNSSGREIARQPEKVMQNFLSALGLLEDPKNSEVFPSSFIEANRRNFSYSAFRGSFVDWHFTFHEQLQRLAPPKTPVDKWLKRIMHGFMRVEQLLLKFYCFRNVPAVFYEKGLLSEEDHVKGSAKSYTVTMPRKL